MASSFVARLTADETTAKRVAHVISETIDAAVASAFERVDGAWAAELHFSAPPDEEAVRALVASAAGDSAVDLQFATVAERDWVAASLEGLKPVRAGRFAVHGAHDRSRIAVNEIGIEIEAALAFGTGHHGTTRGCLLALDALAKKRKPRARHRDSQTILPNQILDLGTGSGVLAIAATRALRSPALATDIDPVAVAAARSNARSNRAGARVSVQFRHST